MRPSRYAVPRPEPAGRPDRAGQVPRPVQRLVPAARAGDGLGPGGDAVEGHAQAPDELEAAAPLAPLVEQGEAEHEGQDGRDRRQHDLEAHEAPAWWAAMKRRSSRSSSADASPYRTPSRVGVQRATPAEAGDLGQERAAGGDEQGDRLGQAALGGGQPAAVLVDDGHGRGLRRGAFVVAAGVRVEERDEGLDQALAVAPVRLALDRRRGSPRPGPGRRSRSARGRRATGGPAWPRGWPGAPAARPSDGRGPGARGRPDRSGGGHRASSTPRPGPRRPSAGGCPGRPRRGGRPDPATASGWRVRGAVGAMSDTGGRRPPRGWDQAPTGRAAVGGDSVRPVDMMEPG